MLTKTIISLDKLKEQGELKIKENLKFRTFLKNRRDLEKLDREFKELHKKLFENYDCSLCLNCCKEYHGVIPVEDLEKDAKYLKMTKREFIRKYLVKRNGGYESKNKPCDLFCNNKCSLNENKPQDCKDYPYTNQKDRFFSLFSIIESSKICPIVYEILEELKERYDFKSKD